MDREEDDLQRQAGKELKPDNFVEKAALVALAKVKLCEKRIAALHFAAGTHRGRSFVGQESIFESQFSKMHASLYYELNMAYKDLFMFSMMSNNKDLEKKAIKMAHRRYLHEGMAIMGYLDLSGEASSYLTLDASEFRADLNEQLIKRGLNAVELSTPCPTCHAYKGQGCRNKKFQKIPPHKARNVAALKFSLNKKD